MHAAKLSPRSFQHPLSLCFFKFCLFHGTPCSLLHKEEGICMASLIYHGHYDVIFGFASIMPLEKEFEN